MGIKSSVSRNCSRSGVFHL